MQCTDGQKQFRSSAVKAFKFLPNVWMYIQVYWPIDKRFYKAKVTNFDDSTPIATVKYFDGDIEKLDLSKCQESRM